MADKEETAVQIRDLSLEDEMKTSYLTYAMSVIVSRALPDVRDGLKPSQRRILTAMRDLNLGPSGKHRKCAKIAGDTSGNYHPHGEQVIYPTLVRLAQDFNMRYPLVDGQGNFGTIDGDPPAAMRYTEARMTHFSTMLMEDIDKNTVDFAPNYDETLTEPTILPSKFPNLLCNGASGIAVAMATSIPPHNVTEVCDALIRIIDNPDATLAELMEVLPGPDFPTGGIICGREEIVKAYKTGRGILTVRGRTHIEEVRGGRQRIVVTEIPYQVNRTRLIEHIAALVKDGKITGISDIRDESDRTGSRLVIELKKGENEQIILNQLFKHTQLQESFSIILIALVNQKPVLLSLRELMGRFLDHRREAIRRRTRFLLDEAERRAHVLDGLRIACQNIDEVIALIRKSKDPADARDRLAARFRLTAAQTEAIIRMPLGRLTGLEQEKLTDEVHALLEKIKEYRAILDDEQLILDIIREDLYEIKEKHADARRTEIQESAVDFVVEDLIPDEDMVVTFSRSGYVKSLPLSAYRTQRRGGKGITGSGTKEGDFIEHLFVASAHDVILVFSDRGKVYGLKVYELPKLSRHSKGRAIRNLLRLDPQEHIASVIAVRDFDERFVVLATRNGIIKKTRLSSFANMRVTGIRAINIDLNDRLVGAIVTSGSDTVFLASKNGMALKFSEEDVRAMGRAARGVIGLNLREGDELVSMCMVRDGQSALTICTKGYGKRTEFEEYRLQRRGGIGIINIKTTGRNGEVVSVLNVTEADAILMITGQGMVVRTPVSNISKFGRATQGVRVFRLKPNDRVQSAARLVSEDVPTRSPGKPEPTGGEAGEPRAPAADGSGEVDSPKE
jgi:DNA gyrase subunit A